MSIFPFTISAQPDDETCGVTCLHSVYKFYGFDTEFRTLSREVEMLDSGGTLAVNLGIHAIKNNFDVQLHSYNLQVFDPTWSSLTTSQLIGKLEQQMHVKAQNKKLINASTAFIEYLKLGGKIHFGGFSSRTFKEYIHRKVPVIVGLSSTFLYQSMREIPDTTISDDLKGCSAGHFVVINGYSVADNKISICDPYEEHPFSDNHNYMVDRDHLLTSIFLGILTYDANFLAIKPR